MTDLREFAAKGDGILRRCGTAGWSYVGVPVDLATGMPVEAVADAVVRDAVLAGEWVSSVVSGPSGLADAKAIASNLFLWQQVVSVIRVRDDGAYVMQAGTSAYTILTPSTVGSADAATE